MVFSSLNWERAGLVLQDLFPLLDRSSSSPPDLTNISPLAVSRRERLLLSTSQNERVVKSFGSLQLPGNNGTILDETLSLFSDHGELDCDTSCRGGTPFLVVLKASVVTSSRWGGGLWGGGCGNSVRRLWRGEEVEITPQLVLHKEAKQVDIFRALVVIHRILYKFQKASLPIDPNHKRKTSIDRNKKIELESLGLGPSDLMLMVREAYSYEREYRRSISNYLELAGWDVSRFMFGTIKRRAEW